jgi:hypothetical protein
MKGRHLAKRIWFEWRRLSSGRRLLPDFIIIGTQKGGTSSLYEYLSSHPNVRSAYRKEVHYFDLNYERGLSWYRAHFPLEANTDDQVVTGEASPYYLDHPHVPRRVSGALPSVKLIAVLRDPVERAFSHYRHNVSMRRESRSFADALKAELAEYPEERRKLEAEESYYSTMDHAFCYLHRGIYADHVARWQRFVPAERLLVLKSEDLFARPSETMAQTWEFLGLPHWERREYPQVFAGASATLDRDTRHFLQSFYAPHNRRLTEVIGREMGW